MRGSAPAGWDDGADAPDAPVLVLRALGLGDALTGFPALRALRRLVAPRPVLLAAPEAVGRWQVELGVVDGLVPTRGLDGPPPGRELGLHDAVDLHGNGPASRDLLRAAGPRRLLAFELDGIAWDPDEHEVRRWCRLVEAVGARCDPEDLRLRSRAEAEAARGRAVVVHPGAAYAARRWPAERWARVAADLAAAGHQVRITGGPGEDALVAEVAALAGLPGAPVGVLPLPELSALLGSARLLLCGDTGVAHLATALAVPSVLLFGPTPPSSWGPAIDPDVHTVLWRGTGRGAPNADTVDAALLRIEPPDVVEAALRLIAGTDPTMEEKA
ncbi:ADP-heptose:LPS heptosyltransferase [Motilibacter peucedani]|uniref:ADP-heptose:LPS heptosyltransferase n=1 Tax=Motilibacter peucedani TaxID=598650 RepID=A0A420XTR6_9ACTN|nr:glycosyltransferase family 9 protein [Motilibacter peucedani]RKS80214.1 ADP-heptose:LPS heptosyltransferase [Motilibacter peucedani]